MGQRKNFWVSKSPLIILSPRMGTQNLSLSHARDKTKKNIFVYFFTELKTYRLSYSTKKLCMSVSGQENLDNEEEGIFYHYYL